MTKPTLAEFLARLKTWYGAFPSRSCPNAEVLLNMVAKAREGLTFIESKADDYPEDWDFPGMATELLGELQELVPEGGA